MYEVYDQRADNVGLKSMYFLKRIEKNKYVIESLKEEEEMKKQKEKELLLEQMSQYERELN